MKLCDVLKLPNSKTSEKTHRIQNVLEALPHRIWNKY